jgi:hypothetical protein
MLLAEDATIAIVPRSVNATSDRTNARDHATRARDHPIFLSSAR